MARRVLALFGGSFLVANAFIRQPPHRQQQTSLYAEVAERPKGGEFAAPQEEIGKRRNLAIIAHPDAGKTTLTEKLLLYGGALQQAAPCSMQLPALRLIFWATKFDFECIYLNAAISKNLKLKLVFSATNICDINSWVSF